MQIKRSLPWWSSFFRSAVVIWVACGFVPFLILYIYELILHIIFCYIKSFYLIFHYNVLYYVILSHIYIILYYTILYYITSYHIIVHYIIYTGACICILLYKLFQQTKYNMTNTFWICWGVRNWDNDCNIVRGCHAMTAITVVIISKFLTFYQVFLSPEVKRCLVIWN